MLLPLALGRNMNARDHRHDCPQRKDRRRCHSTLMRGLVLGSILASANCFGQAITTAEALAEEQPADESSVGTESLSAVRTWHDRTGKFSIEAKLLDVNDDSVRLFVANDERTIEIPLEKLSIADREYCAMVLRQLMQGDVVNAIEAALPGTPPDQFKRGETAVLDAVDEYQTAVKSLIEEDLTSAEYQLKHRDLVQNFLRAVNGKKLRIHFAVRDVQRASANSVEIWLSNCSLAASGTPQSIALRLPPSKWRNMKRGSVVRIDGTINERAPRDLTSLDFQFGSSDRSRMIGGQFPFGLPLEHEVISTITVYVNDFRVLRDDEVAELKAAQKAEE